MRIFTPPSKKKFTQKSLSEADPLPKQATLGYNLKIHHEQLNEVVCFQGSCIHMILLSIQLSNYYSAAITWVRLDINNYPYPPVEAQTRAPLSKRTWTHSGRLWRAAKCNGVAPPASLMFTNLANPLPMPFYVSLNFNHQRERHRETGWRKTNQEFATGVECAAERMAWRQSEWP